MEKQILFWNPWWAKKKWSKKIIYRDSFQPLLDVLKRKEAIFLTGVRRCGKTTAYYYVIQKLLDNVHAENILYLNMDDEVLQYENLEDIYQAYLKLFPDLKGKKYIFLDEVQNVAGWERWIKNKYDAGENLKIFVTGSKSNVLSKSSTLLTGRIIRREIFPLSFREFLEFKEVDISSWLKVAEQEPKIKNLFEEYLTYGGFPEVVMEKDKDMKILLLKNYLENIRNRDVIKQFGIREVKRFEKLTYFLISNVTKPVSASKLGQMTGLSTQVVNNYFDYLEMVYLFLFLNHFSYSVRGQVTLPRKAYSIDLGLVNATAFKFSEDYGRLLENAVFLELLQNGEKLYYFRNKYECDFVTEKTAVQVSKEITEENREINGLKEAKRKGIILTQNQEEKVDGQQLVPVWKWLIDKNRFF